MALSFVIAFFIILFYFILRITFSECVCICMCACTCVYTCVCRCGVRPSGGGVSGGYELSGVDAVNPVLGPLEEHHGLFTVESYLQPPPHLLRQPIT